MKKLNSPSSLMTYGLLGCAVGMVAVPIYIQVPYLYARVLGVPAAWVGAILLISRLIDAVLDPVIGLWVDKRKAKNNRYQFPLALSVPLLLTGMYIVFFPFGHTPEGYAASLMLGLMVVHLGYSLITIAYQAWGAELGQTDKERSTFVAVREGLGILGVVFAVSFALDTHAQLLFMGFAISLMIGIALLLRFSPRPDHSLASHPEELTGQFVATHPVKLRDVLLPMRHVNFRRLMGVFLFNGLAASLPATLVPFYLRDRLGLDESFQWVLGIYFFTGAASTIFWVWLAGKIGLAKSWLMAMIIVIPAFIIVVLLNEGDLYGYIGVCVITGFSLGADLSLPAALLARLIEENGERGSNEGTYFGLWNWVNKFCLALAPTFALGALQWFQYTPALNKTAGVFDNPLLWVYALIPCGLKIVSIILMSRSGLIESGPQNAPKGEPA